MFRDRVLPTVVWCNAFLWILQAALWSGYEANPDSAYIISLVGAVLHIIAFVVLAVVRARAAGERGRGEGGGRCAVLSSRRAQACALTHSLTHTPALSLSLSLT